MLRNTFNIYRVGCDTYDRFWLVSAINKTSAVKCVKQLTEDLGWNEEYPDEERHWEVEQILSKVGEVIETRDL